MNGSALTRDLNEMVDTASKRVHNNFESYERRLAESFTVDQSGYHYKNELFTHEISAETLDYFLSVAIWILRGEERVLRLIAESFDVPAGEWQQLLSDLATNIERFEQSLGTLAD